VASINRYRLCNGADKPRQAALWAALAGGAKSRIMHGSLKNRAEILIPTRLVVPAPCNPRDSHLHPLPRVKTLRCRPRRQRVQLSSDLNAPGLPWRGQSSKPEIANPRALPPSRSRAHAQERENGKRRTDRNARTSLRSPPDSRVSGWRWTTAIR
jgi:hypothetical protein